MKPVSPHQTSVEAEHRSLLILWSVLLMSVVGFFVFTAFLSPSKPELDAASAFTNLVITLVFMGFSLSNTLLSFRFKRAFLAKAERTQDISLVLRAYILALALCESSALFGVLIRFITGSNYYLIAFAIGVFGMVLHFPRKQHLLDASYKQL